MKKNILIVILLIFPWIVGFTIYGVRVATYAEIQTGLTIDPDNLSDGDCYRVGILTLVAGETITIASYASGHVPVYMDYDGANDGGRIFIFGADATDTEKDTNPFLGYAITGGSAGDDISVVVQGSVCREDSITIFTGNTHEGLPIYVDPASAGTLTMTMPTTESDDIQRVGICLRADGTGGDGDIWLETFQYVSVSVRPDE